jgi:hypothetical protein
MGAERIAVLEDQTAPKLTLDRVPVIGRVPHVRQSVRGTKTTGLSPMSANLFGRQWKSHEDAGFLPLQLATKASSRAERLIDLSRDTALSGAESKDPEGAYLTHAVRSFSTTEARTWRRCHDLSLGLTTRTASILLCPPATSTFSAAKQVRFTLASPATCICASCNIGRAR